METAVTIHPPSIERNGGCTRVQCRVDGFHQDCIWFKIEPDPGISSVEQIADAFVLPGILGTVACGRDVTFGFAVSEMLLLNLRAAILPLLLRLHPDLFPSTATIKAEGVAREPSAAARGSATGLSCGLDSLATIADLLKLPVSHSRRLAATAFFDTGNHDPLHTGDTSPLFVERTAKARFCAAEIKLPLFVVQSNVDDWFPGAFARLHTLRNVSAAFLLAPRVRHYVYANAAPLWATRCSSADSAYLDSVLLPLLSTEALTFHSGTPALDSVSKARLIAGLPVAHRHLNVCLYEGHNCSRCEKCLRRMLTLDVVGALQAFSDVFDLEAYADARSWYIGYVLTYASRQAPLQELADAMRATGFVRSADFAHRAGWWSERARRALRRRCGLAVDRF
ncbi:MAG: hypothetical protein KIS67_28255 [Verrucomicrobiae bacterium]|nr:hypothetical protein [Verrucomicrobiae bacterium]